MMAVLGFGLGDGGFGKKGDRSIISNAHVEQAFFE
jgi:hypothetical protein